MISQYSVVCVAGGIWSKFRIEQRNIQAAQGMERICPRRPRVSCKKLRQLQVLATRLTLTVKSTVKKRIVFPTLRLRMTERVRGLELSKKWSDKDPILKT